MANINFIVKNDIELKGNLIFEGATKDAYETTLAITDPTADRTITFPNSTGTVALTSDIPTLDADLVAIGALTGTSGILKKTAANTWSLITDNSTNWDTAYADRNKWDGGATGLTAATGRTSLGATTVGSNIFTLTNPSAISFPKINADNTVVAESAATYKTSLSLNNVENTALSTWAGSTNITTLGAVSATSINSTPIGATTASTGIFTSVGIDSNAAVIDTFSSTSSPLNDTALTTSFPAAEYIVYARTSTGRYTSKVMLLWDGSTTPTITEYSILSTGTITVTVTAVTNTGQLNVAVSGGTVAQIRLVRTAVAL